MKEIIKYSDFGVEVSAPEVMQLMSCYPDNPLYEEVASEYEEIKDTLMSLAKPQALIYFGSITEELASDENPAGTPAAYCLLTEGGGISEYCTRMFEEGDYVKGMIADAFAGSYLFGLDGLVMERLRVECAKRQAGILRRLEAPGDIPMEAQKIIFDLCEAERELGMRISSGYMFDPVKSSGIVLVLSPDVSVFRAQHDCSTCKAVDCKMRKQTDITITVHDKKGSWPVALKSGQSIMEALIAHDQYFSAFCGGTGVCGKCRVRVTEGELPVTSYDGRFFTQEELARGFRLSCKAYPASDCSIELRLDDEETFEIAAQTVGETVDCDSRMEQAFSGQDTNPAAGEGSGKGYGISCDIGTTTIAMSLIDCSNGEIRAVSAAVNHQRMFGADVISRMQASNDGNGGKLQESIRNDLLRGVRDLLKQAGTDASLVRKMVLAGNTTMGHLLMGYSCETLGVYPFTPVNIRTITGSCEEILGEAVLSCPVVLMPGISTYVGADITAGIVSCRMSEREELSLLIDLGTNGEMAIGNKDRILVTSTAAGPAFEGGNISCGMGSVQGAISGVHIEDGQAQITTIGNKPPVGLCGTGVIETIAELVRTGLVDETGLLDEELEDGFLLAHTPDGEKILFTGKDVREVQLAKAAVRAGVETLLLRYGAKAGEIDRVYLAGGFGLKINQDKAIEIGMLPETFRGKIEAVGNSSLDGAMRCLMNETDRQRAEAVTALAEEIQLSNDKDFNDLYMEHMFFDEGL